MHTILGVVVITSLAFIGTMVDNFFAFAAQLVVTERARFRRVGWAQAIGVATIVVIASAVGSLLAPIPIRWIGILSIAPLAFALQAWGHRATPRSQNRRGGITTFMITLALGGDNLAVWIPLFRANGFVHAFVATGTIALWEVFFLSSAQRLATHPRVVKWGADHAPTIMPFVYVALGVLILIECHTI
ncbi:MAG TPA: cadmium resistance transporter [Acidimicrobiales bacterium]